VIEEVGIPSEEEEIETLSHNPLIEELEDSEETIMVEEEKDGEFSLFGAGGGGRGRGNNGGGRGNNGGGRGNKEIDNSFGFPIIDEETHTSMKNISPSVLPNFYGLRSEDLETFLFEFEVPCRTYDYLEDSQKLKFSLQC